MDGNDSFDYDFEDVKPAIETLFVWELDREHYRNKHGYYSKVKDDNLNKVCSTLIDSIKIAEDGKEKLPFAAIPPKVLEQIAEIYQFGAKKYYAGKWLKEPTQASDRVESATRHINQWLQGVDTDTESKKPHLAHAITQLIMALHYINTGKEDGRIYKD